MIDEVINCPTLLYLHEDVGQNQIAVHETDLVQVTLDAGFKRENTFPQIAVTSRVSHDQAGSTKFRDFVFTGARYFSGAVK